MRRKAASTNSFSTVKIAKLAGFKVPDDTKVLIAEQTDYSDQNPYAHEKLQIVGFFKGLNFGVVMPQKQMDKEISA